MGQSGPVVTFDISSLEPLIPTTSVFVHYLYVVQFTHMCTYSDGQIISIIFFIFYQMGSVFCGTIQIMRLRVNKEVRQEVMWNDNIVELIMKWC
jgi:hypothetical protein